MLESRLGVIGLESTIVFKLGVGTRPFHFNATSARAKFGANNTKKIKVVTRIEIPFLIKRGVNTQ